MIWGTPIKTKTHCGACASKKLMCLALSGNCLALWRHSLPQNTRLQISCHITLWNLTYQLPKMCWTKCVNGKVTKQGVCCIMWCPNKTRCVWWGRRCYKLLQTASLCWAHSVLWHQLCPLHPLDIFELPEFPRLTKVCSTRAACCDYNLADWQSGGRCLGMVLIVLAGGGMLSPQWYASPLGLGNGGPLPRQLPQQYDERRRHHANCLDGLHCDVTEAPLTVTESSQNYRVLLLAIQIWNRVNVRPPDCDVAPIHSTHHFWEACSGKPQLWPL